MRLRKHYPHGSVSRSFPADLYGKLHVACWRWGSSLHIVCMQGRRHHRRCGIIGCSMTFFPRECFFRFGNDVEVDFTRCSIADQPELREEICERLTPIKEYTFHVNEEAPIQHYFSSVSVSVEDLSPGIYRINVTTMRIWTENGEKYSTGPTESYPYRYRYDSIELKWEVIGRCG